MTAATEILITLILTFGLMGASAFDVQTTLNNAGFDVSYEDAAYISEYASDPVKIMSDTSFEDSAKIAESIGDKTKESFYAAVDSAFDFSTETGVGGGNIVSVPVTGDYTNGNIFYADNGGYWHMDVNPEAIEGGTNVKYSFVYTDSQGNEHSIFSGNTVSGEDYMRNNYRIDYAIIMNDDGTYTVQTIETWVDRSGEAVTSVSYKTYDLPEDMTSVENVDNTTDVPVNPDGTITLPDGTVVTPNADGSYTIGDKTYFPGTTEGDDAYKDYLEDILAQLKEQEKDKDKDKPLVPEFEKEEEKTNEDIEDAIEDAAGYDGTLSELKMSAGIINVFPFCLPFDFVRGVKLFMATPVPPVFEVNFVVPPVGAFKGVSVPLKIDFVIFEGAAVLIRWFSTAGFIFSLIVLTGKIVKGAGA